MNLEITALYGAMLGVIMLVLWIMVTKKRADMDLSIGDGDVVLHEKIRRHGNFIEWVPMALILMILAEAGGASALWLHIAGIALVVGRLAHPFGLRADNAAHPLRIIGNVGCIIAFVIVIVLIAIGQIQP